MSILIEQARILRERNRYDEAIAALHQHLAIESDDFDAYLSLALTRLQQGKGLTVALENIDSAISLSPESPEAHALRGAILNRLDRHKEALSASDSALALNPEFSYAWFVRACILLDQTRLPEAEDAVRKALALDPDDADCSNLLATVLRLQGKLDQAVIETERQLAKDPENAWTFATSGWTALHQGDRKKAEAFFRESLRLDASLEHARAGLRESYKARSFLYRIYLRWVFFMQRYSQKNQIGIFIAIYLGYRFGRSLLALIHPLAAVPLVFIYLLFCFGSWLASGIGNFMMLVDRTARLTLDREEKLDGLLVGSLFFGGLVVLVLGLTVLPMSFAFLGGLLMASSVPASLVFGNPSVKGRVVFGLITLAIWICGIIEISGKSSSSLITVGFLLAMATTWIGSIPSLRNKVST